MNHEIDLANYQIRTDLAIESVTQEHSSTVLERCENVVSTLIMLTEEQARKIGKQPGNYITIEFTDITDYANKKRVEQILTKSLLHLLKTMHIKDDAEVLVIGLGNDRSTPDALGPMTVDKLVVTRHLSLMGELSKGFRSVCAINPGVTGQTGIETSDIIAGMVSHVKPDLVIVLDALKSQSIDRVNHTIQMTDTGIHPGSGVGNNRKEISEHVLGVPVLAIGVPTVVDLVTVVSDTVGFMEKHFTYARENMAKPASKLAPLGSQNYLKEEVHVTDDDKVRFLGMVGSLTEEETKMLLLEVLTPIGYNLIVTPKEVDFIMDKLSDVISHSLNIVLHPFLKKEEKES